MLHSGTVAVFVSHGGFSSLSEAAAARAPLAILPFFGDQPDNAAAMEAAGAAVVLSKTAGAAAMKSALADALRRRSSLASSHASIARLDDILSGAAAGAAGGAAAKGADLIQLVAESGSGDDNVLQRLVLQAWAGYAS